MSSPHAGHVQYLVVVWLCVVVCARTYLQLRVVRVRVRVRARVRVRVRVRVALISIDQLISVDWSGHESSLTA